MTAAIEDLLGYEFRDRQLLERALSHSSLRKSKSDPSYERLEFLGDRVLGLVIAELLLNQFPKASEGQLGPRLAMLVSGQTLAEVARSIGLGTHILMSESERAAGTSDRKSVLADCCEAVIGAIYLDGGLEAAAAFVRRNWQSRLREERPRVAKTDLQEWLLGRGRPLPQYSVISREGPAHKPLFTVELVVEGEEPVRATGISKRAAESKAAAEMLDRLGGTP